ncbi:MAG: SPOR domain-containing protein [Prevotella sp.]|nr:SPOR domain-containing protein [Prevotella sp.]MBQ4147027.1 SPOR domain-containing protein [Prevotella sp.]MBQ4446124.1 SPOR domain-containing protein [Prevotella sp.]MBQ9224540.1 SPOR domain-containing protein [Prevotella sp.]MBQ9570686.1 SPOR domain-containing protein [Prevotella sp.]
MKKYILLCAGLAAVMAFTSCKSNESAYKKAYEKAKAQESTLTTQPEETTVVAPVVSRPVTETTVVDNVDNVPVRQESLTVVDGAGLRNFSVVVGSFSVKANAEGLTQTLRNQGYAAQIAYNASRNMYRVVASTFSDKASAVRSRNDLRATYPDAWLLYNQQ